MGWFDEQIKQRKQNDDELFAEAFAGIAGAVTGAKISALKSDAQRTKNAVDEILRYYRIRPCEVPDSVKDINERLEYLLRPHGVMRRTVRLEKGWYKEAVGAMLAIKNSDGSAVALIPSGFAGYTYFDEEKGKRVRVSRKTEGLFEEKAVAFYASFPLRKIGMKDLAVHIVKSLSVADFVLVALATLAVTLVGMLTPKLTNLLFSDVLASGSLQILLAIAVFMICVSISALLIGGVKALLMARINTKMSLSVQAATMMRILSLPADFFKEYSAGDLASRAGSVQSLCNMLISAVLSTGLTSVFSLVYIGQIFVYAPALVVPALLVIAATIVVSVITTFVQLRVSRRQMKLSAEESGLTYALISGVQKIKLAGAEKRAFAKWGNLFAASARRQYNPPAFLKLNAVITAAISLAGTIAMYYFAVISGITVADYYAFNTAYGMVSGAFMSLASIALTVANIKPVLEMIKPILDARPEISEGKRVIERLSGGIELNNVSFRYNENMPLIVDNLSLKIRPGQYVALVGATGCGKSTLMRLMLGFETPQKGAVYFDGKDLSSIDLKSLRRKIGVVMQNGKLFSGDVFSNITISAPWLTLNDAWEAAELAGIAEDIRRMPMGMHTIISEGSGGVSGGQRQRLMIARAIAPKPKVLMFDEATSALDNLTQKKVSESLDKLKCTRIVIAHRLSTIRSCDRIIYLEGGKIVEDGNYEELIAKNGKFAELVARQRLDDEDYIGKTTLF
ncbi:MAG: NHLP bacteriocin export ABC transporter permease/ATPase subunit [Bacillota bacterium]|nr:MAG: NHLP bacteriocin export ABC transporter permease/ATPase subunit [Bacillota bacterium]